MDETPVRCLEPGHGRTRKGYLWVANRPGVETFYRWHARRDAECLGELVPEGFEGTLPADGKFQRIDAAATINEVRVRSVRLRTELDRCGVYPKVLEVCRPELLQGNYFHAVLEATKSLSEKIRQKSGINGAAGELATRVFSLGKTGIPVLAFNSLKTETERSEQTGLMNLRIGMFGTFRHTKAHEARLTWEITEQDALDLLTLVSLLHRRVESARRIQ